jgi:hypothetical protein
MKKHRIRLLAVSLLGTLVLLPLSFYLGTIAPLSWVERLVFRPPSYVADYLAVHKFIRDTEGSLKETLLVVSVIYVWAALFLITSIINSWVTRKRI